MELTFFFLFMFASDGFGQAVLSVLQTHPELSQFSSYINASTNFASVVSSANNFTLLAPSNAAFDAWLSTHGIPSLPEDVVEATLMYHLLNGGFPTTSFADEAQFVSSYLTNTSYSNVTGGQRVELVTGLESQPLLMSNNKTVTSILSADILCTGGLIHIVNSVLSVPLGIIPEMTEGHWAFFVGILNKGGYLTTQDQPLVANVLFQRDMTFFAPNTPEALASFTNLAVGASQSDLGAMLNYHVVPGLVAYSPLFNNGMRLRTVQGDNVTITIDGSDTFVNGARFVEPDFLVANGVVHLIDSILDRFNTSSPPTIANTNPTRISAAKSAKKSASHKAAKVGIGVGVVLGFMSLVVFVFLMLRCLRPRKDSERQLGLQESESSAAKGWPILRLIGRSIPPKNCRDIWWKWSYVRQIDSKGKGNQNPGQDFELDANQVFNKRFEVISAIELDAGSLHGRRQ